MFLKKKERKNNEIKHSIRKRFRVSNKVKKVAPKDRFRLCISRSAKNISAQIIDDTKNSNIISQLHLLKKILNQVKS